MVSFEQFTVPGGFYLPCFIVSWPPTAMFWSETEEQARAIC